jgi:predicted transcriptional regulator
MRRNRLEEYLDLIRIIAQTGPVELTAISNQTKMETDKLNSHIEFLVNQGLVEKRGSKKLQTFVATTRSYKILKFFDKEIVQFKTN